MISNAQIPESLRAVIEEQLSLYRKQRSVTVVNAIPDTAAIPIENQSHWLRIPDVICVFVDMKGSTQLSAATHDRGTAGAYQLFTGTAVRLFDELESPYIDVRGDGVFALFNGDQPHRALAAAVTFKTFATRVFTPAVRDATKLTIGSHIGIDRRTVLVRKIGLKRRGGRSDRQNEVWAGKPVNMASKLAALGSTDDLLVSDRYYARLTHERAKYSCGCVGGVAGPTKSLLWKPVDVRSDTKFDFDTAYTLTSVWCDTHGAEYCSALLRADA